MVLIWGTYDHYKDVKNSLMGSLSFFIIHVRQVNKLTSLNLTQRQEQNQLITLRNISLIILIIHEHKPLKPLKINDNI